MELTAENCGAVILAGGISRRMGCCKADLTVDGQTMLLRTREQLSDFDSVLLSCNDRQSAPGFQIVPDLFQNSGPLAGIHAALTATSKEALFTVPCDLPNFTAALPRLLMAEMKEDTDVLICRNGEGYPEPLCGIYRKRVLPVLEACLEAGERKVMNLVRRVSWEFLDTAGRLPDEIFFNMNTPEDYRRLKKPKTEL